MDNKFFLKSFSWVAFANIVTKPLWLLLFIYAARVLGVEQFGVYTYALSIVMIVSVLFDFGLDYIAIREVSKSNKELDKYFSNVISIRVVFFFLVTAIFIIYFSFTNNWNSEETKAIIIILYYQFSTLILTYLKSLVSAFHNFKLFGLMMIFEKLLITILGFISLVINQNILHFLIFLSISNTISLLLFIVILIKKYRLKFFIPDFKNMVKLIREALPLLAMNLFILAYFRIDVVILNLIVKNKEIVGLYGSIHRIVEMYMLVPTILMTTAYPIINKYLENNKDFVDKLLQRVLQLLIIISLPLTIWIALNSYNINYLMFGEQYKEGSKGLIFIIWTIIPLGLNYVLGNVLISIKKQKYCAIGVGFGSMVNIILNLILIPKFSFVGASITAFITESVIFIIYGFWVNKNFPNVYLLKLVSKVLVICAIILFTFYYYSKFVTYNFLLNSLVFIALTILLMMATKLLNYKKIFNFLKDTI